MATDAATNAPGKLPSTPYEKITDGQTDGVRSPYDGNIGFITPFKDSVVTQVPRTGQPTGSVIPKP